MKRKRKGGRGSSAFSKRKWAGLLFLTLIVGSALLTPVFAFGLDDIKEMLSSKPAFVGGADAFNAIIGPAKSLLLTNFADPSEASGLGAISDTATDIMMLLRVCAMSMLNTFFFIGFFRETSDFRNNLTFEISMSYLLRVAIGNTLILTIDKIIKWFCDVGQALVATVGGSDGEELVMKSPISEDDILDAELSELLLSWLIGILFYIGCLACAILICWTIYSAYFKIYFYIAVAPLAVSTVSGSPGISSTAIAFAKTMTRCVCEMGAISIILRLGFALIQSPPSMGESITMKAFASITVLVILTGMVKGADNLMQRGMAL